MTVVRPEYGPTLPDLLRPRLQQLPRRAQRALAVAAAAVVVLIAVAAIHGSGSGLTDVVVRQPTAFTLGYRSSLHRVTPQAGEMLRLEQAGDGPEQSFSVKPLDIGAYKGDVTARLMSIASDRLAQLRKADPQLLYRGEGKARINFFPAYQLAFQTRRAGRLTFGRIFFIANATDDNPHPREGAEVTLLAQHSDTVPNIAAVGAAGGLKVPLRAFRFGTERP